MADIKKTISIIFAGKDDGLSGQLSVLSSNFGKFDDSVKGVLAPLTDLAGFLAKTGLAVGALGAAFLTVAANDAVKFEAAQADLDGILKGVEGTARNYTDQVDAIGASLGFSSNVVLRTATTFREAGYTMGQALDLTQRSLELTRVSGLGLDEATTSLKATLIGFSLPAVEAAHVLDVIAAAGNDAGVNAGVFAKGLAAVAPVAKLLGLSIEETTGFLAPLTRLMGDGEAAAATLRVGFLNLSKPSTELQSALEGIGVKLSDTFGVARSGKDVLTDLQSKFVGLNNDQQTYIATLVGGSRQAGKFAEVLRGSTDVQTAFQVATNSSGAAASDLAIIMDTVGVQLERVGTLFEQTRRSIGDQFLGNIRGATSGTADLLDSFKKVVDSGGLEPLFKLLRPLIDDFTATVLAMAKNLPAAFTGLNFTPIVEALTQLGSAAGGLFSKVDLRTPEGLRTVLQELVNIGGAFIKTLGGLITGIGPLFATIATGVQVVSEFGGALTALGVAAAAAVSISALSGAAAGVTSALTGLGKVAAVAGLALGPVGLVAATGAAITAMVAGSGVGEKLGEALFNLSSEAKKVEAALAPVVVQLNKTADSQKEATLSIGEVVQIYRELGFVLDPVTKTIQSLDDVYAQQVQTAASVVTATDGIKSTVVDGVRTFDQYGTAIVKATGVFSGLQTQQKATEKTSDDVQKKLLDLASDERIKTMEFKVKVNIAQIENDTERIKAAFASVNGTVTSTGDTIQSALGALKDVGGFNNLEQLDIITRQLDKENEYRQQALDLQKKTTEATVQNINAKTAALQKGGAIIKIDGSGLAPELEAFMFAVLKRIQVRANAEAGSFLLGI